MALNKNQKRLLLEDGFTISEVLAFSRATGGNVGSPASPRNIVKQDVNFNSKPFLAMRRSRRRYCADLRKAGWTNMEIKGKISEYYRLGAKRNPWDFLKAEYRRKEPLTDFMAAIKKRNRSRLTRTFGKLYARHLHEATKVRTIPKRPLYPSRPKLIRRVRRTR
jgi:hypothetical protein